MLGSGKDLLVQWQFSLTQRDEQRGTPLLNLVYLPDLLLTLILGLRLLVRQGWLDVVPPDLDRGIVRSLLLGA